MIVACAKKYLDHETYVDFTLCLMSGFYPPIEGEKVGLCFNEWLIYVRNTCIYLLSNGLILGTSKCLYDVRGLVKEIS